VRAVSSRGACDFDSGMTVDLPSASATTSKPKCQSKTCCFATPVLSGIAAPLSSRLVSSPLSSSLFVAVPVFSGTAAPLSSPLFSSPLLSSPPVYSPLLSPLLPSSRHSFPLSPLPCHNTATRCIRDGDLYDAISCPAGHYKRSRGEVAARCAAVGRPCSARPGYQCLCSPCLKAEEVEVFAMQPGSNPYPHFPSLPLLPPALPRVLPRAAAQASQTRSFPAEVA
jgi:hypothetical protein